jgi:glycosyltransferase involved in cell wall biosynthesis
MKILYLYSELVGYQIPVLQEYVNKYNAQVHVVSWDKNKLKPYVPPECENITFYKRSEYNVTELARLAAVINPDIVYISGWMDKDYLTVAEQLRRKEIPVVSGFDDVWEGRPRQLAASLLFKFTYKKYFSHAWVAGPYQFEFVSRLGFAKDEIIFNLLSANTALFNAGTDFLAEKKKAFPKAFLYAGNFREIKGTDILAAAFAKYRAEYHGDWKLICAGNGPMENLLKGIPEVEVAGFSGQHELLELVRRSGIFILPSRHEQWGVVVHEFTAAGMPLILSEAVGSRPVFLIEGFNGMSYSHNSVDLLAKAMDEMSRKSDDELVRMGRNSAILSGAISPEISAASFVSILK